MTEREQILMHILKCRRIDLHVDPPVLSEVQAKQFHELEDRRASGEPLQYLLGETDFMGHRLEVGPRVLIPRPETEILVSLILESLRCVKKDLITVLDLGTGSGNIAVALAREDARCRVDAVDCSSDAITLADRNVNHHDLADRVALHQEDMVAYMDRVIAGGRRYDLIVSNPPYIASAKLASLPADVQREPRLALDGGARGLRFYERIIARAHQLLVPGGELAMEIGDGQEHDIRTLFSQSSGYNHIRFHDDYVGTPRIVRARLHPTD